MTAYEEERWMSRGKFWSHSARDVEFDWAWEATEPVEESLLVRKGPPGLEGWMVRGFCGLYVDYRQI